MVLPPVFHGFVLGQWLTEIVSLHLMALMLFQIFQLAFLLYALSQNCQSHFPADRNYCAGKVVFRILSNDAIDERFVNFQRINGQLLQVA